jgi:spore germination cell wall hydrolase CwlJ-like protein
LTAKPFASTARALTHALAIVSAAFVLFVTLAPSAADDRAGVAVLPAAFTPEVAMKRQALHASTQPPLTTALLAAYVERQKALQSFDGFEIRSSGPELTEALLSSYIARNRNRALDAIDRIDTTQQPALTAAVLSGYAEKGFVPTGKKVKLAEGEKLCLAQAIYHEARGESLDGQLAVANVIINRAMSTRYPSTICGVVFQNADRGRYKCQFTFACDGRSDLGKERGAWNRSVKLAETAFYEFQQGDRPGVVPNSVLFYHTTAVAPNWSRTFRRVAAIGSHIFYAH